MTRSLGFLLSTCICTLLLSVSTAKAAGGQIAFSGAVVEPTCSINDARVNAAVSTPSSAACSRADTLADAGRIASLTATDLDVATADHDRLLTYFSGYLGTANIADAKLVTQTFE
jgi:type 1 fimbria pilin